MKSVSFRIGVDILIVFLIFLLPWWLASLAIISGLFLFQNYFEVIFFGFIFDSLYSSSGGVWHYAFTLIAFAFFCAEITLKQRVRF